jgi:hypothetical protein
MRLALGLCERTTQFRDNEYIVAYYPANEGHQIAFSNHAAL